MPQGASKYDPLKRAVAAEAPAGRPHVDPLGSLLDFFKQKAGTADNQVLSHSIWTPWLRETHFLSPVHIALSNLHSCKNPY